MIRECLWRSAVHCDLVSFTNANTRVLIQVLTCVEIDCICCTRKSKNEEVWRLSSNLYFTFAEFCALSETEKQLFISSRKFCRHGAELFRPRLTIGHFRITFGHFFKASPGAHLLIWKLVFICMWMETNFHMKGWAPGLALKKRPKVIRKWPIAYFFSFGARSTTFKERVRNKQNICIY